MAEHHQFRDPDKDWAGIQQRGSASMELQSVRQQNTHDSGDGQVTDAQLSSNSFTDLEESSPSDPTSNNNTSTSTIQEEGAMMTNNAEASLAGYSLAARDDLTMIPSACGGRNTTSDNLSSIDHLNIPDPPAPQLLNRGAAVVSSCPDREDSESFSPSSPEGTQLWNDLESSVVLEAVSDETHHGDRPDNNPSAEASASADGSIGWNDPNFFGREMFGGVPVQGNPHLLPPPPPVSSHVNREPPPPYYSRQIPGANAARSGHDGGGGGGGGGNPPPGYRPRPFVRSDAQGSGHRPAILRAVPVRGASRTIIVGVTEVGGRRVLVQGTLGARRTTPIRNRDVPGADSHAPIVTRDIPVSDTESIIPRTRTVTPGRATAQTGKRSYVGWIVCLTMCSVFLVAGPVILGIVLSRRSHNDSANNHFSSHGGDHNEVVPAAKFYGSFLFEEKWYPDMSDDQSSAFHRTAADVKQSIDQFFSFSALSKRFDHSIVTHLSKHKTRWMLVSVILKFREWHTGNSGKSHLESNDVREAFLNGRLQLLNSNSVSHKRKALAVKILPDSLYVSSNPIVTSTTTAITPTPRIPDWRTTRTPPPSHISSTPKLPDVPCGEVRVLPDLRIVGGSETRKGGFPWMVMLIKDSLLSTGRFFCGGSILDRWNIITAGHCLQREPKDSWTDIVNTKSHRITVIAGKHESNTSIRYPYEQRIPAQAGYMHPDFEDLTILKNDIAVIRLSRPLQFNSRVAPICLPHSSDPLPPVCVIAGWGAVDHENEDLSQTLRSATLRAYNRSDCVRHFQSLFSFKGHTIDYYLKPGMMCAANGTFGGQDTCQGDSGGPLFCLQEGSGGEQHYTQFGVVSWGYDCGLPGQPGFYTYLPHFVSWVRNKALPYLDKHTTSKGSDTECRTFSPMTDYRLYSCRSELRLLKLDTQCSYMSQAVSCVVSALGERGHACTEQEVFATILNSRDVGLSSLQRQRCEKGYSPSKPETSAICHNYTTILGAVTRCTQNLTCVSLLEVTMCVHSFVDPYWQQCSRQTLQDYILTHVNQSVRICEEYTVRTLADGRHFMMMGGDWYVLCADHWGQNEVNVVCANRGFKAGNASYLHKTQDNVYVSDYLYERSGAHHSVKATGWLKATCTGYETSLAECELEHKATCSSHYLAASLCYNTVYKFSTYSTESGLHGYINLNRDEGEGFVCVPELSDTAAHLLCRGAGAMGGMVYPKSMRPPPSGHAVWETEMTCGAGAVDVNGCAHGNWTLRKQGGSRSCSLAQVFCFQQQARLHNGLYNRTGIVQMYQPAANGHGVTLKTVCRQGFDDVAARVACNEATNRETDIKSFSFNPFYRPNTAYVSVHCSGDESFLCRCQVRDVDVQVCTGPAVVACNPIANGEPDLSVRLNDQSGQVQVSMGGQWGTVCTDHWTDSEAAAICRQLGHLHGYRRFAPFKANPRRSLPHVLHSVRCGANASSLHQCSHSGVTSDACQHSPSAAVLCSNHSLPTYFLTNSSASELHKGIVYVNYNSTTAPLRARLSNMSAVCQKMGFVTGEKTYMYTSLSYQHLWFSFPLRCGFDLECLQSYPELINCSRSSHYNHQRDYRCSHPAVVVSCYTSAARVHTGGENTLGIVQLYRRGTWWEVCHNDVTQPAADVICRDIMKSSSASAIILRGVYRHGFYQKAKASVYCDRRDPGMTSSDCIVLDLNSNCESFNNDPASVVCYDGHRPSDAVTEWKTDYQDRVWVKRYGLWGTVCADLWTNQQAQLLCRHIHISYSYGSTGLGSLKHDSTKPMWVWSVICSEFATQLHNCHLNLTSVDKGQCQSDMDAKAVCTSTDYYD